jgi:hypothetical protein
MQEGMWMARGVGAWVQVAVTCVEGTALVATGWAASEWAAKGPAKECRLSQYCEVPFLAVALTASLPAL